MILLPHTPGPETPLRALGLEPEALHALEALSVFLVEDLAACTRTELSTVGALGTTVIARLERVLSAAGMSMMGSDAPEIPHRRTRGTRGARPHSLPRVRQPVPIERFDGLAFTPATLRQIERLGLTRVGELSAMTVRELVIHFRNPQAREIYQRLTDCGPGFRDTPRPFELWRLGLIATEALRWPFAPSTPVRELRPWMGGGAVRALHGEGVTTLGELRARVRADSLEGLPLRPEERRRVLDTMVAHDARRLDPDEVTAANGGAVLASTALHAPEHP